MELSDFIPAPALALPILLLAANAAGPMVWYSWDPNPLLESGPATSQAVCSQLCSIFLFNTPQRSIILPVFTPRAQTDFFFEGTSVLRDTEGHPGSSEHSSHHPLFSRHASTFSHPIKCIPRLSGVLGQPCAGAGARAHLAALCSLCITGTVSAASAPSPSVGHRNWPRAVPAVR